LTTVLPLVFNMPRIPARRAKKSADRGL
jgi:hypothetical protein